MQRKSRNCCLHWRGHDWRAGCSFWILPLGPMGMQHDGAPVQLAPSSQHIHANNSNQLKARACFAAAGRAERRVAPSPVQSHQYRTGGPVQSLPQPGSARPKFQLTPHRVPQTASILTWWKDR